MAKFKQHKATLKELSSLDFLQLKENVSRDNNNHFDELYLKFYSRLYSYVALIFRRRRWTRENLWYKFAYTIDDIIVDGLIRASQIKDACFEDISKICWTIIETECDELHLSLQDCDKIIAREIKVRKDGSYRMRYYEIQREKTITKIELGIKNKKCGVKGGIRHPKYSGDYVVNGIKYKSSYEASEATGMHARSIQRWCKENKKGFSFIAVASN